MKEPISSLKSLAEAVGEFIAYWGFRGIHGQIWIIVWLSREAQTGAQIGRALGVSKALVSTALSELEAYDLIRQVDSVDGRAKCYVANPDVYEVIKTVLRQREMKILSRAEAEATYIRRLVATDSSLAKAIMPDRLEAIESMISAGNGALALLTASSGLEDVFLNGETKI